MLTPETIDKIVSLGEVKEFRPSLENGPSYTSKPVHLLAPPEKKTVVVSTLHGLVDLFAANYDNVKTEHADDVLVHIVSPTVVQLTEGTTDAFGRLRVFARAEYPEAQVGKFKYATFMNPEAFIILAHTSFQRVKIENDDGSMAKDLDYILKIASAISAGRERIDTDDGISQTVQMKAGVTLKSEETLRGRVNLAPYRTFAEIDQVVSEFLFRAHGNEDGAELALFEGDGGRWRLAAVAAIAEWLDGKFGDAPIIS
jgi:hypothetical protein